RVSSRCISLRVVSKLVKRKVPLASSCTQATLLYLPRSMARMVLVDAALVRVFMLQAPRGGCGVCRAVNFRLPRPHGLHGVFRRRKATRKEALMSEKKAPGKLAHAKGTRKPARSTTKQAGKKAAARPGPRADEADGETAVLAKIAAMPGPDRAMGE